MDIQIVPDADVCIALQPAQEGSLVSLLLLIDGNIILNNSDELLFHNIPQPKRLA